MARLSTLSLFLILVGGLLATGPVAAESRWLPVDHAQLSIADGWLQVSLRPDRGQNLPLAQDGAHRWRFEGSTAALVGRSYSVVLDNRSRERLKVVVAVDGLNLYGRVPVVGRADRDVGSILGPWMERALPGWQMDDDRAQRFVFSPPEWSEGQGRTDDQIGEITVQVYREWQPPPRRYDRDREESRSQAAPESIRRAPGEGDGAVRPPIGTTTGDDVGHSVRRVQFRPATLYPEAWAVIDYGQALPRPRPRPGPLGLELRPARHGASVVSVAPGSPAADAGVRPADVIVRIDSEPDPSPARVRRVVDAKRPGDFVFLRVRRGSHELALKIRS